MDRYITAMLKDFVQLINIGRNHILFYNEVFKAELFFNCKVTLGNFCSTSVNPVSQSLKAVMTELSGELTNFHYDVNGHGKTSMYFLCSNFFQINDNVVAVKKYVARTTTVSDMRFFS